jgi:hypothetical protein
MNLEEIEGRNDFADKGQQKFNLPTVRPESVYRESKPIVK